MVWWHIFVMYLQYELKVSGVGGENDPSSRLSAQRNLTECVESNKTQPHTLTCTNTHTLHLH